MGRKRFPKSDKEGQLSLLLSQNKDREEKVKVTNFSDINLAQWKDYEDIITGSLWLLGRRDDTGPHSPEYWGNFVPQIAYQIIRRFSKQGEVVVDLFSGLGTTLIECCRLGRHGIGVELNEEVAHKSEDIITCASNNYGITTKVLGGLDSTEKRTADLVGEELNQIGFQLAHLLILHPPYHNIIKFSQDSRDLCNSPTIDDFLNSFHKAVENAISLLEPHRFLALVIGDKYAKGEWIPLGFKCMEVCQSLGLKLKAINVKDIQGNERGKGVRENLWRYRALKEGFYIFKHEYIMVFQKEK